MAQQVIWDEAIAFNAAIGTGVPNYWVSVGERVRDQPASSRGKQYEWDQQQAGTYTPTLINQDAALLPGNASSPFAPNVLPRRPYRKRFQYPATQQLLTRDQATCGEGQPWPSGTLATVFGMGSTYDASCATVTSGTAFQGTQVLTANVPSSPALNNAVMFARQWTMHPGQAHTVSMYVRVTTGASPTVHAAVAYTDVSGNFLSETAGTSTTITSGSTTWVRLTATGTPPAGACGIYARVTLTATSGSFTMQSDGWQAELAAAASTWTLPGVWGGVFPGWTDRIPQVYSLNGTYATATPTVVDTFGRFSQIYPPPPFYADVLALGPTFFFPLDDPSTATVFRELTGNYNPAKIQSSPQGAGTIAPGQGVQGATTAGTFLGAPGPVVQMTNPDAGTFVGYTTCSCIELDSSGIAGPPVSGGWTRMIAFNNAGVGASGGALWMASNASYAGLQNQFSIVFGAGSSPGIGFEIVSSTAASVWSPVAGSYADGNWHLMFVTLTADGKTVTVYIDGVSVYTNTTTTSQNPTGVTADNIGAIVYPGVNQFYYGYNGSVAHVGQFPFVLSSLQIAQLVQSWKNAWSGDSTGVRYARILTWAGYTGPSNVAFGATTDMGPATDVDGQTDAFTLLQNVVTTEAGNHYISVAGTGNGTVTFEARTSRYDVLTPTYTFGANTAAGELPFFDLGFDFDLDHVANVAQITQQNTGQGQTVSNAASQAAYDTLTLQRTINVLNMQEVVDCANYMVNRYDQPQLRINSITLAPSRYTPDNGSTFPLWGVLAALDISTRIRVNLRTVGQFSTATPLVQFDGFVEQVSWQQDAATGDAMAVLQVSPADLQLYWVLSALHTTVRTAVSAGANAVVLNALPDSASNPASASFCSGLQLTLDPGTASAETLTVLSFSATTAGYTSFTVTFTANLAFNHAANAVVCEKLPTGTTNPSTWDAASILGTSTTLAY